MTDTADTDNRKQPNELIIRDRIQYQSTYPRSVRNGQSIRAPEHSHPGPAHATQLGKEPVVGGEVVEEVRAAEDVAGHQLRAGLDAQAHQAAALLEHDRVGARRGGEDLGHAAGQDVQVAGLAARGIAGFTFSLLRRTV